MGYTSITVILNPAAGSGTHQPRVRRAAQDRQIDVREMHAGDEAGALAREVADDGAQVLIAAGRDGTLSAVAGVAAQHDIPLVVVPCSTRNHFAKDCWGRHHQPGRPARIDVGTVNGRVFLDNVSVGFYATMVRDPQYRQRRIRVAARYAQRALLWWVTRIAAHRSTSPGRHPGTSADGSVPSVPVRYSCCNPARIHQRNGSSSCDGDLTEPLDSRSVEQTRRQLRSLRSQ